MEFLAIANGTEVLIYTILTVLFQALASFFGAKKGSSK